MRKLRGPKGTTIEVSLKRAGYDQLIDLDVPRDEITIPTIRAAFMVDDKTGYVRMQDFAEHTDRDLGRALTELTEQGHAAVCCSTCATTPAGRSIRPSASRTASCREAT